MSLTEQAVRQVVSRYIGVMTTGGVLIMPLYRVVRCMR